MLKLCAQDAACRTVPFVRTSRQPGQPLVLLERIQNRLHEATQKLRQLDRVKFHAPPLLRVLRRVREQNVLRMLNKHP